MRLRFHESMKDFLLAGVGLFRARLGFKPSKPFQRLLIANPVAQEMRVEPSGAAVIKCRPHKDECRSHKEKPAEAGECGADWFRSMTPET